MYKSSTSPSIRHISHFRSHFTCEKKDDLLFQAHTHTWHTSPLQPEFLYVLNYHMLQFYQLKHARQSNVLMEELLGSKKNQN